MVPYNVCVPVDKVMAHDLMNKTGVTIIVGCMYVMTIIASVVLNAHCIYTICIQKYLHTVRSFFLVSLFAVDLLTALSVGIATPITARLKIWIFGAVACKFVVVIQAVCVFVSTLTLTAIAIDRYILIVHPTKRPINARQAGVISVHIWTLGLVLSAPIAFVNKQSGMETKYQDRVRTICGQFCNEDWSSESVKQLYGTAILSLQFLLPLGLMVFCYLAMFVKLNQQMNQRLVQCATSPRRDTLLHQHARTTKLLVLMVVVFAMSWLPQVTLNIVRDFGMLDYLPQSIARQQVLIAIIAHWLALASTVWNALLYAGLNVQLRQGLIDSLPACLKRQITVTPESQAKAHRARRGSMHLAEQQAATPANLILEVQPTQKADHTELNTNGEQDKTPAFV